MMKRVRLMYIVVAAFALGIFMCRSVNAKSHYVPSNIKQILNKIKMKEREGQLGSESS